MKNSVKKTRGTDKKEERIVERTIKIDKKVQCSVVYIPSSRDSRAPRSALRRAG